MIRSLTCLLDEWIPIVAGSEILDDPYSPVSRYARDLVGEHGAATRVEWVHRDDRFGEKLATPDTSIADLIGEVDPIKVAEGRYLSDEVDPSLRPFATHQPRYLRDQRATGPCGANPGGLLNSLKSAMSGSWYKVRLALDVMMVRSRPIPRITPTEGESSPHSRIVSEARFAPTIRLNRYRDRDRQPGSRMFEADGINVIVPDAMREIVASFSHIARSSPHVNQRSASRFV